MNYIVTERGVNLPVYTDMPEGRGPFPVLVVAPGLGYNATLPLFSKIAEQCRSNGIICVRFEWGFFIKNISPSENYVNEKDDYNSAVKYAKNIPEADTTEIIIAGKSLGAFVALDYAVRHKDYKALILLTPPLHPPQPPYEIRKRFEGLDETNGGVAIIYGDKDPLCHPDKLKELLDKLRVKPTVYRLRGNHSFKGDTQLDTERNLEDAAMSVVGFVQKVCGQNKRH